MGHYFINDENLKSEIKEFKTKFLNQEFNFKTDKAMSLHLFLFANLF